MEEKTIFAQITPPGISAIASIRISGKKTFDILKKLVNRDCFEHRKVYVCKIIYKNKLIDKAIISIFKAPNSYTGEDIAEISVHGGYASITRLKEILFEMGLSYAQKGEFTKRAYKNNKLDLLQAEAILSITNARTVEELDRSLDVIEGVFSRQLEQLKDNIINIKSFIDGSIDFPEDIDYSKNEIINFINNSQKVINKITDNAKQGLLMSNGLNILITGRTNTGKSTIFNKLINEDRAIITDIPGTTRDIISKWIKINGIPILLMDSAGIRKTDEKIEQLGILKVKELYKKTDIFLFVFDMSCGFTNEDIEIFNEIKHKEYIIIGNKSDIKKNIHYDFDFLEISALKDNNIVERINKAIEKKLNITHSGISYILNERENNIVMEIKKIIENIDINNTPEIISEQLNEIIKLISNLTGKISNENILNNIFEKFCIGK